MTPTTTPPIEQQRLVQAWASDPERIFHVPKYDGTNEDEPVKVLRFVAICQSTTGGLYVHGLDNNVETLEIELDDLRLESLNAQDQGHSPAKENL